MIRDWALQLGAPGFLAVALLAGHCVGDFALQSRRMVERKPAWPWLGAHAAVVGGAHLVFLLPWFGQAVVPVSLALAVVHGAIDWAKGVLLERWVSKLTAFGVDQVVHVGTLVAAWWWLQDRATLASEGWIDTAQATQVAVWIAGFSFVGRGGSAIVAGVLDAVSPSVDPSPAEEESRRSMGHLIGILERWTLVALILLSQWGALGWVLAAKSLARFRDLEDRVFSEYYLVGTLTSFLVALATGLAL